MQTLSQARDFSLAEATKILEDGMKSLGLAEEDIAHPESGDPRRAAIGWVIWHRTSGVPHSWIAETLGFRTAANSSQQIRLFGRRRRREIPREIRRWMKKFNCKIAT